MDYGHNGGIIKKIYLGENGMYLIPEKNMASDIGLFAFHSSRTTSQKEKIFH